MILLKFQLSRIILGVLMMAIPALPILLFISRSIKFEKDLGVIEVYDNLDCAQEHVVELFWHVARVLLCRNKKRMCIHKLPESLT